MDGIRSSIRNLWDEKASRRDSARQSRAKASSYNSQAEEARARLKKAQQLMVRANSVYQEYAFQARQTEARFVQTRARIRQVDQQYKKHQALFGARLASVQRNGQLSYLNMVFGSRTLSDLSRRIYLYQAIAERDADLQETIKDDQYELGRTKNLLMSQWNQRNRLVQAANRERSRLVLAQSAQARALKAIKSSVYTYLAQADARRDSADALDTQIYQLESQRTRLVAAARAEREQEYSSYTPRRASRSYARRDYNSNDEARSARPYRRRYYRKRVPIRRTRTEYVPAPSGELKPMRVKETAYEDVLVPEQSNGELGETFESESPADSGGGEQVIEPWTPPSSN